MNALDIIKNGFKMLFLADETMNVSTKDGLNLIVFGTELATGLKITQVNSDGTQTDLADGDYILTSGQTITVAGSLITGVIETPAESNNPDAEGVAAEEMVDAAPTDAPVEDTAPNDLETRVAKIEEDITKIMEVLNQILENSTEMKKQTSELKSENAILSAKLAEPAGTKPNTAPMLAGKDLGKKIDMTEVMKLVSEKNK